MHRQPTTILLTAGRVRLLEWYACEPKGGENLRTRADVYVLFSVRPPAVDKLVAVAIGIIHTTVTAATAMCTVHTVCTKYYIVAV